MLNTFLKITLFICLFGMCAHNSFATIIVSGDVTIIDPIDPNYPEYQFEGNKQFFLNVLQGSHKVAVVKKETDRGSWNQDHLYCLDDEEYAVKAIDSFYNASYGITSSVIDTITAPELQNLGLLIVPLPASVFSEEELSILNGYINNGGSIFFLGEAFDHPEQNTNINQALLGIGSTLSITDSDLDIWMDADIYATDGQIINSSFTTGIDSLSYAYASEVKGGDGRLAPIFLTKGGIPFIAYEQPLSVPEPSTIALLFISLPALLSFVRKRKK
jgi:hypothetical protein